MGIPDPRRSPVRSAAAILAAILLAATVFTYLSYTADFTDTVTVTSPRAGLVMERDAKVNYRGIQVGPHLMGRLHQHININMLTNKGSVGCDRWNPTMQMGRA